MFNIVKGVLVKYHTLFMRMTLDTSTIPNVRSNFFLFIDVKMLLGLNVVILLLDAIKGCFCVWFQRYNKKYVKGMYSTCNVIVSIISKIIYSLVSSLPSILFKKISTFNGSNIWTLKLTIWLLICWATYITHI